jgi:hypothetical protein
MHKNIYFKKGDFDFSYDINIMKDENYENDYNFDLLNSSSSDEGGEDENNQKQIK